MTPTTLSGLETVRATADPVHDIGTAIYLSPEVAARAAGWGWANPFAFYAAGRAGVMGEVDRHVALATFGWFNPEFMGPLFDEGVAVGGARHAAERMFEATAAWGRDHLAGVEGLDGLVELAARVADGAEGSGRPLFCGWRDHPRAADAPGAAAQLLQTLREWRGAAHLVGTTAAGLTPLQAILTNEGPTIARFFGWPEPYEDCAGLAGRHDRAQAITDELCAAELESLLDPAERAELAAGVTAARAAVG